MDEIQYKDEWLRLAKSGEFEKAKFIYYERLFPEIINSFKKKYNQLFGSNVFLISILGFSPEPIILTTNAIQPESHLIITSENKGDSMEYVSKYVESNFRSIALDDTGFDSIYKLLKEELIDENETTVVIDITGGKKSMVCAASIFGRDYNCNIVYVDFDEYIKELRKPMPGSEYLNIVYDPVKNNPLLHKV